MFLPYVDNIFSVVPVIVGLGLWFSLICEKLELFSVFSILDIQGETNWMDSACAATHDAVMDSGTMIVF